MSYIIFILILIEKSWQASYAKNSRKSFFWVVKIQNLRLKMVVKMASLPLQMLSNRQVFPVPYFNCLHIEQNFWRLVKLPCKVEKILRGSLESIPSPSPYAKIKLWAEVCLRYKGKTLLGIVNKLFVFTSLLTLPSKLLPSYL